MLSYKGKHLLVDAVCEHDEALLDLEVGKACLAQMARTIGMNIIMPPTGVQFPQDGQGLTDPPTAMDDGATSGYSAFVMLAESHISLHTFPEARFLTFDCYSCKDFDHTLAEAYLNEVFGVVEQTVHVVSRTFPGEQTSVETPARPPVTPEKRGDREQVRRGQ